MTPAELKAEIQTGPLAAELAPHVASGNDGAIAAILNDNTRGYTTVRHRLVSARGVLEEYAGGPVAAAAVLDKLEQASAVNSVVKWAFGFLTGEGLDVGSPTTRAMLDQLAQSGLLTTAEAENLKLLGVVPASRAEVLGVTIDIPQVATALRG